MKIEEVIITGLTVALGESALEGIVPSGIAGSAIEIGGAMYGSKKVKGGIAKGVLYGVGILGIVKGVQEILGSGIGSSTNNGVGDSL